MRSTSSLLSETYTVLGRGNQGGWAIRKGLGAFLFDPGTAELRVRQIGSKSAAGPNHTQSFEQLPPDCWFRNGRDVINTYLL